MPRGVKEPLSIRFWRFVDKSSDPNGCWIWTGYKDPNGYGRVSVTPSRDRLAHRACWMLTHGVLPAKFLLHKCDNPSCVRPDHLVEGTQADNMKDMRDKGRGRSRGLRGEQCNFSKLTTEIVLKIREESAAGETQLAIARKYGFTHSNVNMIVNRKTWTHV